MADLYSSTTGSTAAPAAGADGGLSSLAQGLISGGASSAVGAGLSALFNFLSMKRQHKYQMEMVNKQNELQRSLIQDNALLQKTGLAQAGYSTANPDGTNFSGAPTVPLGASPTDGAYSSLAGLISQNSLVGAQIANLNAQTKKTNSETDYQLMYNDLYQIYGESQMKSALENLNADTKLKVAQEIYNMNNAEVVKNLSDANIKNIEQRLDMDWQKLPKELQLLSAQAFEAQEKGNLSHAEISKVWQDIKESQQRIVNLQHEVVLTDAQVAVAYALTSVYAAQEGNIKVDTNGKIIENSLNRLNKDIQEGLGVGWHQAAQVLSSLIPFAGASVVLNRGK